jgi:hypothetical protein
MGEGRGVSRVWWGNLRERDRWGDPGVDGRIMSGWIFKKWVVGVRTGLGWLRIGTGELTEKQKIAKPTKTTQSKAAEKFLRLIEIRKMITGFFQLNYSCPLC